MKRKTKRILVVVVKWPIIVSIISRFHWLFVLLVCLFVCFPSILIILTISAISAFV